VPRETPTAQSATQRVDAEYTALIKQYLTDERISTELVDHLPASDRVPTPLKFLGRVTGQPGYLTYAHEIHAYMKAIADAMPTRARFWTIGQTEEGRDQIILAIANEETIRNLDRYKADLQALTDPRRTTEAQARTIIARAKPIYWLTSGVHSTERGGPEMLTELAYRLVVSESPFVLNIEALLGFKEFPKLKEEELHWNYARSKPLVRPEQIPFLPMNMYKLHDWYMRVTKEHDRESLMVNVKPEHYFHGKALSVEYTEFYHFFNRDTFDISILSSYCL
jgi:hypothetical protein